MRHRKTGVKLNRTTSHRQAMFRNMVTSLFKHDRIRTTDAKAKELRRWADHIITLAKRGDLHARRQAMAIVREKEVVHKLFEEASEKYGNKNGGYTRIVKIGRRAGDAAPLSLVELIFEVEKKQKDKKKKELPDKKAETTKTDAQIKEAAPAEKAEDIDQAAEAKVLEDKDTSIPDGKGESSVDEKSVQVEGDADADSDDTSDSSDDETTLSEKNTKNGSKEDKA
ncbi:MAG: 50S ribosomal protein L17 [Desulfobacteraceae bacterium]|nr:50S ribosomal protein L17 [Desulfobacteraceae bacterium]